MQLQSIKSYSGTVIYLFIDDAIPYARCIKGREH